MSDLADKVVRVFGYRGPYRPRRPVLQHPPAGIRVLYKPAENAHHYTWERCCVCRRDFRMLYPEGYEGAELFVLACSPRCTGKAVVGEWIAGAERRPRETFKSARAADEIRKYLAWAPAHV